MIKGILFAKCRGHLTFYFFKNYLEFLLEKLFCTFQAEQDSLGLNYLNVAPSYNFSLKVYVNVSKSSVQTKVYWFLRP